MCLSFKISQEKTAASALNVNLNGRARTIQNLYYIKTVLALNHHSVFPSSIPVCLNPFVLTLAYTLPVLTLQTSSQTHCVTYLCCRLH